MTRKGRQSQPIGRMDRGLGIGRLHTPPNPSHQLVRFASRLPLVSLASPPSLPVSLHLRCIKIVAFLKCNALGLPGCLANLQTRITAPQNCGNISLGKVGNINVVPFLPYNTCSTGNGQISLAYFSTHAVSRGFRGSLAVRVPSYHFVRTPNADESVDVCIHIAHEINIPFYTTHGGPAWCRNLSQEPCARSRHPDGPDTTLLRYPIHTDLDCSARCATSDMDSMHGRF